MVLPLRRRSSSGTRPRKWLLCKGRCNICIRPRLILSWACLTVQVKVQDRIPSMILSASRCKAGAPAFFHPFYSTAIRSSNLIYSSRFRTSNNRWMRWLRPWFKNVQWPPLLRCRRRLYAESAGSPIAAAMMPATASADCSDTSTVRWTGNGHYHQTMGGGNGYVSRFALIYQQPASSLC